ncbi:MAG: hypothetical protein DGJ47_000469 [Rickettsiaceae bacterium]
MRQEQIFGNVVNQVQLIDNEVGKRIYNTRKYLGMSRKELAEYIGITQQQLSKYENGTNRISAGRLLLVSKKLCKNIRYFFNLI